MLTNRANINPTITPNRGSGTADAALISLDCLRKLETQAPILSQAV